MSSQVPVLSSARTAWTDLFAAASAHPLLALVAVVACSATSIANVAINPNDDTALALALGLGLAVAEAFLLTPVLIASHRFVILGEVAHDYAKAWLTRRFWRFFLLSSALVASLFAPMLLTRWRPIPDEAVFAGFVAAVIVFVGASLWLSLMFPAIAVDAPGASVKNAAADLRGNVWQIFWVGTVAALPLLGAGVISEVIQGAIVDQPADVSIMIAFAPAEGILIAALYVLLVVIASRFYLAVGNRLRQPD